MAAFFISEHITNILLNFHVPLVSALHTLVILCGMSTTDKRGGNTMHQYEFSSTITYIDKLGIAL